MHSNGRIYIETSVTPRRGITHGDLRAVFDVAGRSMGAILQQAQVNPWAKYKPTRCGGLHPADWWQGPDGRCGFAIPSYAGIGELIGTDDVWEYQKPRGNAVMPAEWYVRRDLDGYNHYAEVPYTIRLTPVTSTDQLSTAGGRLVLKPTATLPQGNLLLSDIFDLDQYYFGIVVVRGSQAAIRTNAYDLASGTGGDLISLDGCPLAQSAGVVDLYAVIVPAAQTSWTTVYERQVFSLNCMTGLGHSTLTITEPVPNVCRITLGGLSGADRFCWRQRGVIPSSLTSGDIIGTDVQDQDMSDSYTLQRITWTVERDSDSDIILSGQAQVAQAMPGNLPARRDAPGSSTTFRAPYNVGTLPALTEHADFYRITYTFIYAPDA